MSSGKWQINAADYGFEPVRVIEGNLNKRIIELNRCQEMQVEMAVERFYGMPLAKVAKYPRCQAFIKDGYSWIEDINSGTVICRWGSRIEHDSSMQFNRHPYCLETRLSFTFEAFDSSEELKYYP